MKSDLSKVVVMRPRLHLGLARASEIPAIREFVAEHGAGKVRLRPDPLLRRNIEAGGCLLLREGRRGSIVGVNFRVPLDDRLLDLSDSDYDQWDSGQNARSEPFVEMAHSTVHSAKRWHGYGAILEAARTTSHINEGGYAAQIWMVLRSNAEQIARLQRMGMREFHPVGTAREGWAKRAASVSGLGPDSLNPSEWIAVFFAPHDAILNVLRRGAEAMRRLKVEIEVPLNIWLEPDHMDATANYFESREFNFEVGRWRNFTALV